MKKIAFMSQKGGSGKTTLAVHTAVAAQEMGEKVVIIDTDPQKSATVWGDARIEATPIVATAPAADLSSVLEAAKEEGITLVIIDAAPHAAPDASRIAKEADLVVIPCRPSALDIATAAASVDIAKAAGTDCAFVLSACPQRALEISETRTVLSEYGYPISPVEIADRRGFSRALATGRAVTEFDGNGKAAGEIRALWSWIKEQAQ